MTLPQVTSTLFQNINSRPTTVARPEAKPMIWSGPPYKASSSGLIIIALVSFQLEVLVNTHRMIGRVMRERASGTSKVVSPAARLEYRGGHGRRAISIDRAVRHNRTGQRYGGPYAAGCDAFSRAAGHEKNVVRLQLQVRTFRRHDLLQRDSYLFGTLRCLANNFCFVVGGSGIGSLGHGQGLQHG